MSTLKMEPEQGRGQEGSDWKLQNRGGRDSSDAAVISHIVQQGCRGQGSPKVGTTRPVEPLMYECSHFTSLSSVGRGGED